MLLIQTCKLYEKRFWPRLHLSQWNRSKIGTNGPCVYTGTLGTAIRTLLGPLKERFQLEPSVRFQCKRTEPNGTVPKESGYVLKDDSFLLLFHALNTVENWTFVI